MTIMNSIFDDNYGSTDGGALHVTSTGQPILIANSIFIINRVSHHGGAVNVLVLSIPPFLLIPSAVERVELLILVVILQIFHW